MSENSLIAVVDDDEAIREATESLIRSVGLRAAVFASAEDFLRSSQLQDIACVIVDVRMPGMSGLELQRQLATAHYAIPIIFITAHGDPTTRAHIEKLLPGTPVLTKPITSQGLKDAIASVLAK